MSVRKFLDLSTAHLDVLSKAWLHQEAKESSTYEGCYGWFTSAYPASEEPDGVSDDPYRPAVLTAILRYAVKHKCDYVLFDADAEMLKDLPIFEEES